jgi:hypothetical protein
MNPAPAQDLVRRRFLMAAAGLVTFPATAATAAETLLETSVKAAYLYKFLGYVEWPGGSFSQPDSPIVIGVMGAEAIYSDLLQILPGRTVHGRVAVAKKIEPGDPADGLHVLYLGNAATHPPGPWLQRVQQRPVLLVSDTPGGLGSGSVLNFILVQGRVRFEASVPAAESSGLKLSSRLLAVAERVVATR